MCANRLNVITKKITSWAAIIACPPRSPDFMDRICPTPGFLNPVGSSGRAFSSSRFQAASTCPSNARTGSSDLNLTTTNSVRLSLDPIATMRVKACSLVPIMNLSRPEMDQSEAVTLSTTSASSPPPPCRYPSHLAAHRRRPRSRHVHQRRAHRDPELVFNPDHEPVDSVSDDRQRASKDGKTFAPQRWSTPPPSGTTAPSALAGASGTAVPAAS